jgi:hypothetical protein
MLILYSTAVGQLTSLLHAVRIHTSLKQKKTGAALLLSLDR